MTDASPPQDENPAPPRPPTVLVAGALPLTALILAAILVVVAAFVAIRVSIERGRYSLETDFEYAGVALYRLPFDSLPGWRLDNVSEALAPFLLSCERLDAASPDLPFNPVAAAKVVNGPGAGDGTDQMDFAGRVGDWLPHCGAAGIVAGRNYSDDRAESSAVRDFFVSSFEPVLVTRRRAPKPTGPAAGHAPVDDPIGKVTGYFEPAYQASASPTREFSAPAYARPADLVSIELGDFAEELRGRRVFGRLSRQGGLSLAPYPGRREIEAGALSDVASPLAYLRPNDLFFLQIQGSGRLIFRTTEGAREVRIGYDGANGRPYFAIGRALVERGVLALEDVSMQSIRDWLETADPAEAAALRQLNESYVFFRTMGDLPDPTLGPVGAEGIQLTNMRSLAVDPAFHGYGSLIWVATKLADGSFAGRLQVAQDTGGAIKGPIRGDVFVGSGAPAGALAGAMNEEAAFVVLLPKRLAEGYPALRRFPTGTIAPAEAVRR